MKSQDADKKIDIIGEKIELGGFDTTFLAISIFISSLIFSLALNPEYIKRFTSSFFQAQLFNFLLTFTLCMFLIILIYFIIIFKKSLHQFQARIWIMQLFFFYIYICVYTLILSFLSSMVQPSLVNLINDKVYEISVTVIQVIGIFLILIATIRKKGHIRIFVHNYFKNYPLLYDEYLKNNYNLAGEIMKKLKSRINNYVSNNLTFTRLIKAFLFAVTIGLGVYLGNFFIMYHWLIALIIVTLILWLLAGNLLDVLYHFKAKPK